MSAQSLAATLLGSDVIGVLVVAEVTDEQGHRCGEMTWQESPIEGAPTISRAELADLLRTAADSLAAEAGR